MTTSDDARRVRRVLLIGNVVAALAVSVGLLALLGAGVGGPAGVPALGPFLVPGHGGWTWQFLLMPVGAGGLLP